MRYPTIPHDEKKSVKLKYVDIENIKYLFHVERLSVLAIANKFNVSWLCIKYHLDPSFRELVLNRSIECNTKRYKIDERFKQKQFDQTNSRIKQRLSEDKEFRKWYTEIKKKWYDVPKNKKKRCEYDKKYRNEPNIKKKIKIRSRRYYNLNRDKLLTQSKTYQQTKNGKMNHEQWKLNNIDRKKENDIIRYKNKIKPERDIIYAMRWFD